MLRNFKGDSPIFVGRKSGQSPTYSKMRTTLAGANCIAKVLTAVVWMAASPAAAHARQDAVPLKEGLPTAAVLDMDADPPLVAFSVTVPKDAVLMSVKISRTPVILDILARKKQPIETVGDAEYRSNPELPTRLLDLAAEQPGPGGRHVLRRRDVSGRRPADYPQAAGEKGSVHRHGVVRAGQGGRGADDRQEAHQPDPRRGGQHADLRGRRAGRGQGPADRPGRGVGHARHLGEARRAGLPQRGCRRNGHQRIGPQDLAAGGPVAQAGPLVHPDRAAGGYRHGRFRALCLAVGRAAAGVAGTAVAGRGRRRPQAGHSGHR